MTNLLIKEAFSKQLVLIQAIERGDDLLHPSLYFTGKAFWNCIIQRDKEIAGIT